MGIHKHITKNNKQTNNSSELIWKTIEDFGISKFALNNTNPTPDELDEIYHVITAYRTSVKYLKQLKFKIH